MAPAAANEESPYLRHWSRVYAEDPSARTREWHCAFDDAVDVLRPYVAPIVASSPSRSLVVDVGCGGSSIGYDLAKAFAFTDVLMTDIDPGIVEILRERYASSSSSSSSSSSAAAPATRCEVADARSMPTVPTGAAVVVLDKGTVDALHGDDDKLATLRECVRMANRPDGVGVVASISFPAADRLRLLERVARETRVGLRVRVVGDGDPARGRRAVFVAVLGKRVERVETPRCELSETVLARIRRSGSVVEDEPAGEEDALTLFDDSDGDGEDG